MDSKQLQDFKEQLEQMKRDVIFDVEQTLSDMTSQNGNIPDPNDRATVESDRALSFDSVAGNGSCLIRLMRPLPGLKRVPMVSVRSVVERSV
jgi:RNA polymerase-binding transcription factor DksA